MTRLVSLVILCLLALFQPLAHAAYAPTLLRHNSHFLHAPPSPLDADPAPTHTITLPLDHLNPSAHPTFALRYWVNATLYKSGAPLFFSLGGEGPESPAAVSGRSGLAWYAGQFDGLMVAAEHRFYGESVPGNDVSVSNLRYLTSTQALADFAALVANLTAAMQLPASTPVIAVGGSYSGSLSAWFHLKYPQLVHGSLASSAPVQAQLDFPEYMSTVQRSLGAQCSMIVANATRLIETLLETPAQRAYLARVFNVCEGAIEGELERDLFMGNLLSPLQSLVQYNTNYRAINISTACRYMADTAQQSNALTALLRFNEWYNTAENASYPFAQGAACQNDSYSGYLRFMQGNSADRQWMWQTCNEFGFYQTAQDVNYTTADGAVVHQRTVFSRRYDSLDFYLRQCNDLFGITAPAANVQATLARYGGWHVSTNRTVWTNGLVDPWHTMSVVNDTQMAPPPLSPPGQQPLNLVNLIGPTSHCQDLVPPRASDIPQLQAARYRTVNQMSLWLTGRELPSSTGGATPDGSSGSDGGGGGSDARRSAMSSGAVVGIVVFCVLVAVIAMVAAVWYYRKRQVSLGGSGAAGVGYHEDGLTTGYSSLLGGGDARSSS